MSTSHLSPVVIISPEFVCTSTLSAHHQCEHLVAMKNQLHSNGTRFVAKIRLCANESLNTHEQPRQPTWRHVCTGTNLSLCLFSLSLSLSLSPSVCPSLSLSLALFRSSFILARGTRTNYALAFWQLWQPCLQDTWRICADAGCGAAPSPVLTQCFKSDSLGIMGPAVLMTYPQLFYSTMDVNMQKDCCDNRYCCSVFRHASTT